jgi:hypothetical protein
MGNFDSQGIGQRSMPGGERNRVKLVVVHPKDGDERLAPGGRERILCCGLVLRLAHKYPISGTSYAL